MFHAKVAKKAKRAKGNDSSSLRALHSLRALRETDNSLQKDFPLHTHDQSQMEF